MELGYGSAAVAVGAKVHHPPQEHIPSTREHPRPEASHARGLEDEPCGVEEGGVLPHRL